MVLTRRVGKRRPFWRGLVLTIVTLGLYSYYWAYKAHTEVFRQYELDREGRDDGVVWLVLGIILPVLLLVYYWKFVDNVNYVRARMRLEKGIGPLAFVGLHLLSGFIVFLGVIAATLVLFATGLATEAAGAEDAMAGMDILVVLVYVGALLGAAVVLAYPYYALQRDINESWTWFDAHVHAFMEPPPSPNVPPPPPDAEDGTFDPPV